MGRIPRTTVVLLALIGMAAGSCKTTENESAATSLDPPDPGEVRVLATVVEIDTTLARRSTDPCSRMPCRATLRIDSVGQYGAAFPRPLSKGEHLRAHFAFTLAPTDEAMPELATPFPGLEEGSSFWTNLSGHEVPGPEGGTVRFIVYEYMRNDP